ncbi:MAG TPA: DUF695 domain-containing protein [Nitratifractor sp.]|nr:DUF695 domain-containing protein [Nitratifractor sp.]
MQEYWEIYMKQIDGKVASVLFNAGISMDIEKIQYIYPTIAYVKVKLKEPKANGLVNEDEGAEIAFLEDKLEAALIKFRIGKYVGRVISNGYVTFLYYLQFTYNWQDFLDFALDEHQNYEITSGYSDDSEWNYYKNLLFPNAKEWQIIQNHKVCKALEEKGENLEIPRIIEHKIYFTKSTLKQKEELLNKLEIEGFQKSEELERDGVNGAIVYRTNKPFYTDIDEITLDLIDICEDFNAIYDGWETKV